MQSLWRAVFGCVRIDRGSADFISALIPDPYPAAAVAQFGPRSHKMPCHFVSGRRGAGGVFEQHSSGVQNHIVIEEEVEEKAGHSLGHHDRAAAMPHWERSVAFE